MSKQQVFYARLLSTVVLWSFVLGAIVSGSEAAIGAVICALGLRGLSEYMQAVKGKGLPVFDTIGLFGGGAILIGTFLVLHGAGRAGGDFAQRVYDVETGALLLCTFLVFLRQMGLRQAEAIALPALAYTLFGIVYVGWLFAFCAKLLYLPPRDLAGHVTGHWLILYLCVVAKFSDMGAYVTGSLIGKHLMIPHISPNKTWEGFAGALLFSTGGSYFVWKLLGTRLAYLHLGDVVILGAGLGLAAVIGDLAESVLKRSLQLKDSGRLLPGIGGALDLIDSVLFTAPLLFFYLRIAKQFA